MREVEGEGRNERKEREKRNVEIEGKRGPHQGAVVWRVAMSVSGEVMRRRRSRSWRRR